MADTQSGEKPEACASCNAPLKDVLYEGDACPHCGYDLAKAPLGTTPKTEPIGRQTAE